MDVVWNKHYKLYIIVISVIPQDYEVNSHILFVRYIYYFQCNSISSVKKSDIWYWIQSISFKHETGGL